MSNLTSTIKLLASTDSHHKNILICPSRGIIEYNGVNIPGVIQLTGTRGIIQPNQHTWEVMVFEPYQVYPYSKVDGTWFPPNLTTWTDLIHYFNDRLEKSLLSMEIPWRQIKDGIRDIFPEYSDIIDCQYSQGSNLIDLLFKNQYLRNKNYMQKYPFMV